MKKWGLVLIILVAVVTGIYFISATNDKISTDVKLNVLEKTWDQLENSEKAEIFGSWEEGSVEIIVVDGSQNVYYLENQALAGKEVYLVTFESNKKDLLGNVRKLVDMETSKVVGYALRD